jgi:hypothetical protein
MQIKTFDIRKGYIYTPCFLGSAGLTEEPVRMARLINNKD